MNRIDKIVSTILIVSFFLMSLFLLLPLLGGGGEEERKNCQSLSWHGHGALTEEDKRRYQEYLDATIHRRNVSE